MSTQGLDALAALCGNAASAAAANNNNNNDGDKSGESSAVPIPRASSGQGPSLNNGLQAFFQQQGQQQQQFQQQYIQQQAAGLQQAAAARQALSSLPPQLLQAYLSSQPGIGQALQAALAGGGVGGGQFAPAAAPATASLTAALPGLAAAAEQQQQHQSSQLQMIAAQFLAAQAAAAAAASENKGQVKINQQPQPNGECFCGYCVTCTLLDVHIFSQRVNSFFLPLPSPQLSLLKPQWLRLLQLNSRQHRRQRRDHQIQTVLLLTAVSRRRPCLRLLRLHVPQVKP